MIYDYTERNFDMLKSRYRLGSDPYDPRDNILAGTAYIREMHDRFGAPGFLAAYNAGPDRVEAVVAGPMILPEETVSYVASVGPRLGFARTLDSPFTDDAAASTRFGRLAPSVSASTGDASLAYAGGGLVVGPYVDARPGADDDGDPLSRAFDGGGLVTPDAPTGTLNVFPRYGVARSRLGLPGWRSR